MGSMTGAPKISAMETIEELEETKRGLYSGAVGYFTPNNDFDFNVVIRSIQYNKTKKYTSFIVGGAITSLSEIDKEYEVNPIQDLRPVCPNCHAMIHKKKPAYNIEEIQSLLAKNDL